MHSTEQISAISRVPYDTTGHGFREEHPNSNWLHMRNPGAGVDPPCSSPVHPLMGFHYKPQTNLGYLVDCHGKLFPIENLFVGDAPLKKTKTTTHEARMSKPPLKPVAGTT